MVLHRVARGDSLALGELGELVLAADVLDGGLVDDEVRGEHGCGDLAAVGAVADEGIHEVLALSRLYGVSIICRLIISRRTNEYCTAAQ